MYVPNITDKLTAFRTCLVAITLAPLYYCSYRFRVGHAYGSTARVIPRPAPTDFVHDWLNVYMVGEFNPYPLASYCNHSEWHPNLVFRLDNANGGIGNVRGNVLDFVFYAIEAGASIVLPDFATRSKTDISNVWADRAGFDIMFDEQWFLQAMGEACPQMAIYKPQQNEKMVDALPGNYLPKGRRIDMDKGASRKAYLEHLDAWLKTQPAFNPDELTLVNLERTLWEIDTRSLPRGLRRAFGQLLRVNPPVRRLAAIAVHELSLRHGLRIDPRLPIPRHAFYGAHLRTEADAQNAGWTDIPHGNFSAQTDAYIAEAIKHNFQVLYVASGNATDIEHFKAKAAAHAPPLNVTSKLNLLAPDDLAVLERLSWDQQSMVDYEILQRATLFGGFVKSSFSYNIALSRNQYLEDMGVVLDPWFVTHKEVGVAFDDGFSRVLGRDDWHEKRIPRGMWP